jgi:hypothetical protein
MRQTIIARWESRSGKHWANLIEHEDGCYTYDSPDAGGCIGVLPRGEAMETMQGKVASGYFLPDNAKTPMRRVS